VARKKVVGQKLQRQLDSEEVGAPRTRKRGYDVVDAPAAMTMIAGNAEAWADSAWVAHGGALHALLYLDPARFAACVSSRINVTGVGEVDVWNDVAEALVERAAALCRAVYARGGTPVFIDGVSRLVADDLGDHDSWLSRMMRRIHLPDGAKFFAEADTRGVDRWHAAAMLAYLVETTTDDIAKLCDMERADVLAVVWDGWDEG
jgi:hypothetical protein